MCRLTAEHIHRQQIINCTKCACGFDRRGSQHVLISIETTVVSNQQFNVAMTILYNYIGIAQLRTKHYDAVHITQPFLGYHDTLCIQVSLFLHQISTYFLQRDAMLARYIL